MAAKGKFTNLSEGDIKRHLWNLSLPLTLGIFANMSFNLVDTYFLGQVGADELNAISFSFPIVIVFLNLAIGSGIGINAILSQILGREQYQEAKNVGGLCIVFSILIASILCVLGMLSIRPLFLALGAKENVIPLIQDYMYYAYPAMSIRIVAMAISAIFRAYGDTKVPSKIIFLTAGLNLILDPILIFGFLGIPALGIQGAGIATLFANILACWFSFHIVFKKYEWVSFQNFQQHLSLLKQVIQISIPAAAANALNPLSIAFMNYLAAQYSQDYVGGIGIATKIQAFIMIPVFALSAAISSFVGQNFAQKRRERILQGLWQSNLFSFAWPLVVSGLLYFIASPLSKLFSEDPKIILASVEFLQIIPLSLFGYGFVVIGSAALNSASRPYISLISIALRTFLIFAPFAFLLKDFYEVQGIYYALAASNISAGLFCLYVSRRFFQRL